MWTTGYYLPSRCNKVIRSKYLLNLLVVLIFSQFIIDYLKPKLENVAESFNSVQKLEKRCSVPLSSIKLQAIQEAKGYTQVCLTSHYSKLFYHISWSIRSKRMLHLHDKPFHSLKITKADVPLAGIWGFLLTHFCI